MSEISDAGAWLFSDHVLRNNSWDAGAADGGTRFQWPHPPAHLRIGTLWSFRGDVSTASVLTSSNADPEKEIDPPHAVGEVRFRSLPPATARRSDASARARPPLSQKIRDSFEALEAIRKEYFDEGTESPPHGPLYVSIPEHLCMGPLTLSRDDDGCWRCHSDTPVELYAALSNNKYKKVTVDGLERYVLLPRTTTPHPLGSLDLRPNDRFLEDWLAALGQKAPDTLSALSKVTEALSQRTAPELSEYAALRLLAALERVREEETTRDAVCNAVLALAPVRALIDEGVARAKEEATQAAQEALTGLREEEKQLRARTAAAQVLLDGLQTQTRQVMEATAAAAEERSLRAMTQTAEAFAAAVRQLPAPSGGGSVRRDRGERAYLSLPNAAAPKDVAALSRCLHKHLLGWEVEDASLVAAQLTAAWLCGLAPVIAGTSASQVLRSAAATFAGGRLHVADVSAAVAEAADLFGRPHAPSGVYAPHPGGLADLFLDEGGGPRLHVVAFDGVNRCDADAVFLPLIASAQRSWDGGARLPLLHAYSVSADDPYRPLALAVWPRNFLPVFVYCPGASSLPLSPAFWASAALIIAEGGASGFPPPSADVPLEAWAHLRVRLGDQSSPSPSAARFQSALAACGTSPETSARAIHEALALPLKIATGDEMPPEGEVQAARVRRALFGGA